ncbi:hypothetical protein ACA910_014634 [Epithemia clementina (nom. ined.)]
MRGLISDLKRWGNIDVSTYVGTKKMFQIHRPWLRTLSMEQGKVERQPPEGRQHVKQRAVQEIALTTGLGSLSASVHKS